MSRIRVGLVCGYLDPTLDGVADYTRQLAARLRPGGVDPVVVTTHECARPAGSDVVGVCERWDVQGVGAAARALRRLELDIVHVQFAPSVFGFSRAVGLLPLLLPRRMPIVATLHEYGVWSGHDLARRGSSALWGAAERRGYVDRETLLLTPRAEALLVPSAEHLAVLRARFPGSTRTVLHVPIGLNVEVVTGDATETRNVVRSELGLAPDDPLVVFFGFLHPEKALDQLIAAVAAIRAERPGIQLLLIGGGESHSVAGSAAYRLQRELERVAASYDLAGRVRFTGYLPEDEVSRLLAAADAAAFPFRAGVTRKSSSLLAALAAGVPVVATALPGEVREPTEVGGTLRVPPSNVAALTAALDLVLSDRSLAARLSAAGRVDAASQGWPDIVAAHREVYSRALASRRSGSTVVDRSRRSEHSDALELVVKGNADVTS